MRMMHQGVKKKLGLTKNYLHGNGDKTEYHFHGGNTRRHDPEIMKKLDDARDLNIEYLTAKWDKHWRTCWPTVEPWLGQAHHLTEQRYDLEFLRKKYIGF